MTFQTEPTVFEAPATEPLAGVTEAAAASGKTKRGGGARSARKSKKDQLTAMIAKTDGARISVLVERLGWQAHTVRAAVSRLRKQGHQILASKSPRTGEAIYRLMTPARTQDVTSPEEAAS